MAKILLAWELGGGLGHLGRLLPLVQGLRDGGHEPFVAVRDLKGSWPLLQRMPTAAILQAPVVNADPEAARNFRASHFADILHLHGWGDANTLRPVLGAWDSVIRMTQPDVLVCDYCPFLLLAARNRVRRLVVGDGFTHPPTHLAEFPVLAPVPSISSQPRLLETVRALMVERGQTPPETLPAALSAEAEFVCTLDWLDPYQPMRAQPAVGPLEAVGIPCDDSRIQRDLFIYLAAEYRAAGDAARAAATTGLRTGVFIRGAPDGLNNALRQSGLEVFDEPPALAQVLAGSRAIMHHAGQGTSLQCVAAGRPQIVLPRHLEQALTARALIRKGVARAVPGVFNAESVATAVRDVTSDPAIAQCARAVAADTAQGPSSGAVLGNILGAIERLV